MKKEMERKPVRGLLTLEQILARFENVKQKGTGYLAKCPCHPDTTTSLQIHEGKSHQCWEVFMRCMAGCETERILEAVGLTPQNISEFYWMFGPGKEKPAENVALAAPESGGAVAEARKQSEAVMSFVREAGEQIQAMAEMIRITNEQMAEQGRRMAEMEKALRTLEKVSPMQAGNIGKAIRGRGTEICREYRIVIPAGNGAGFQVDPKAAKAVATAIRRAVKEMTGAKSMREVARCDYDTVIAFVMDWDDYDMVRKIRKEVQKTDV